MDKVERIADELVNRAYKMQPGELLVITSDCGGSDLKLCDAVYAKAREAGAEAMIIRTAPAECHGKEADKVIPFQAFTAMMMHADCWLDTGSMGWLYSDAFEYVLTNNKRIRYYLVSNIAVDRLYDMIVLPAELPQLALALRDLLTNGSHIRVKAANGTDVEICLTSQYPIQVDIGDASKSGCFVTPPALANILPEETALNGTIVVNCIYADPWGLTKNIVLQCKDGAIVQVGSEDPADALKLKAWLARWNDPNIYRTAHVNFGLLPGVRGFLDTGVMSDGICNERMWGCMNWGFGEVSKTDKPPFGQPCKSHFDCVTPKVSAWLDGVQFMENGEFIFGKLKELADAIKK